MPGDVLSVDSDAHLQSASSVADAVAHPNAVADAHPVADADAGAVAHKIKMIALKTN